MSRMKPERKAALWLVKCRGRPGNGRLLSAVDAAIGKALEGVNAEDVRERLRKAILLNCDDRDRYPYRYTGLDGISERDFYRRKGRFLDEVYRQVLRKGGKKR